jgi:hypothetical protein
MDMKKSTHVISIHLQMAIITVFLSVSSTSGQAPTEQRISIPDDISTILRNSCYSCHGNNTRIIPMAKLNFLRWDEYGDEVQAVKATRICASVTEGTMPPKSSRKSNPELIPGTEQILKICGWSESFERKQIQK